MCVSVCVFVRVRGSEGKEQTFYIIITTKTDFLFSILDVELIIHITAQKERKFN